MDRLTTCILDVNGVLIDSSEGNARATARAFSDDRGLQEQIVVCYPTLTGIDRGPIGDIGRVW